MTLGQKLRFYRTAEGYSQEAVARLLQVERSTYTYYERDRTLPNVYALFLLSKIFHVTMEKLVDTRFEPVGAAEFLEKEKKSPFCCRGKRIEPRLRRPYRRKNTKPPEPPKGSDDAAPEPAVID